MSNNCKRAELQQKKNARLLPILASLWASLWLLAGFLIYGSTGHDDSHITFWAAHTLLTENDIRNYNGDALLQSSSLLMTALTAAASAITRTNVIVSGYGIGIIASLACCLLIAYQTREHKAYIPWMSIAFLSSSCSFLLWTFSGMESTLAALCMLCVAISWQQWIDTIAGKNYITGFTAFLATATLITVRPEMPLVASALAVWAWLLNIRNRLRAKRCLQLLLGTLVLAALSLLWQKYNFENWLPQPVSAKQDSAFTQRIWQGYVYTVYNIILNPLPATALLLTPIAWWKFRNRNTTLLSLLTGITLIYLAFIITAGGDWMQAGRFFVPILPVAALLLATALPALPWRWLAHTLALLLCFWQIYMQYSLGIAKLSHGIPLWAQYRLAPNHQPQYSLFEKLNQEHLRDMAVIDHLREIIPSLHQHLQRPVRLMSGQAGMVFYYTAQRFGNDVHFTDLRGLVEDSLTLCAALDNVPRSAQGLFWSYRDFFERREILQKECNIDMPDIIYDINDMSQKLGKTLEPYGYTMIHQERGFVLENNSPLPANRLLSPNMIFVRNELLPLLSTQEKRIVDYTQLPLHKRY